MKYTVTNNANGDIVEEADRDINVIEYEKQVDLDEIELQESKENNSNNNKLPR